MRQMTAHEYTFSCFIYELINVANETITTKVITIITITATKTMANRKKSWSIIFLAEQ